MIREFSIKNYKSILDHTLELGRLNVFIGENGCGKTNLLEALAMASAAIDGKLGTEELYAKGIRIAKPDITFSSFAGEKKVRTIELGCSLDAPETPASKVRFMISSPAPDDIGAPWESVPTVDSLDRLQEQIKATANYEETRKLFWNLVIPAMAARPQLGEELEKGTVNEVTLNLARQLLAGTLPFIIRDFVRELDDFVIYNLNALALRGMQVTSRKEPLGIYGENVDILISTFDKGRTAELLRRAKLVSWVDDVLVDVEDTLKLKGFKLGRSASKLYFKDRYMRKRNNVFSAENANDGILHVLFYLALFLSDRTPAIFAIDNIETALNPQLCRELTKELAALSKTRNKQALITTHNPAVLDGLDLHDDEQRLFVVYRNDDGHTVTRRVKVKPSTGATKYKLSELWMRGHLGGLPKHF